MKVKQVISSQKELKHKVNRCYSRQEKSNMKENTLEESIKLVQQNLSTLPRKLSLNRGDNHGKNNKFTSVKTDKIPDKKYNLDSYDKYIKKTNRNSKPNIRYEPFNDLSSSK